MIERVAAQVRERPRLLTEALKPRRLGQLGIALGVFGGWIAYPPIEVRTVVWVAARPHFWCPE